MIFHSLVLYAGRKIFIKTEILCYIFAFHTYNIYHRETCRKNGQDRGREIHDMPGEELDDDMPGQNQKKRKEKLFR